MNAKPSSSKPSSSRPGSAASAQQLDAPDLAIYRRLLSYAFQYKILFAVSILGFALFAGMEALLVKTMEFFVDGLGSDRSTEIMWFIPLAVIVLTLGRGVGYFFGTYYLSQVGLNVVNDLRKQLFGHMIYLPQSYFDRENSGELVSIIIYNIEQVKGSITRAIQTIFRDGFSLIAFLGIMFYYNWKLTFVFFAVAPFLAGIVYIASRYFRRISRRIQNAVGKITHVTTESFQGIKLVKSFNGETYEKTRFESAADENLRFGKKFERVNALQAPVLHSLLAIDLAIIFFLIILFWEDSAGAAVAYVTAAGLIAKPFKQLSTVNAVIQKGLAAAETLFTTLDYPTEKDSGSKTLHKIDGEITFDKVCFSYKEGNAALTDISFKVTPGETVALVGRSGSGKSTLANLLLRFYDASSGKITLDGVEIKTLQLSNLRSLIALVNQQTILFNDTVESNIAYAQDAEHLSRENIERAAEQAFAKHFIDDLEAGFETFVGEDGTRLSGGQKQRIAIARAIFKNAPVLVLDEATSALDNESEKQIQTALDTLTKNRTTIVIAHRLSTIENADKIIVLDKGRVVESGSHTTLLAKGGHYANLHKNKFES